MFFSKFPSTTYDFYSLGKPSNIPNLFRQIRANDNKFDKTLAYQTVDIMDERPDQLSQRLYNSTDYHWTFFIINDSLAQGLYSWPMVQSDFNDYIAQKYQYPCIRLYRAVDDDINYNSIVNKFKEGVVLTGATSGASASIISRDPDNNQIYFKYDNSTSFIQGETITSSLNNTITDKYFLLNGPDAVHHWEDTSGERLVNFDNVASAQNLVMITNTDYENSLNESRSRIRVIRKKYIDDFVIQFRRLING